MTRIGIVILAGSFVVVSAQVQTGLLTPHDLIASLEKRSTNAEAAFGPICGPVAETNSNRAIAQATAKFGPTALPGLTKAIASVEEESYQSPYHANMQWILYAYAVADGPHAYSYLSQLIARRKLTLYAEPLDTAIALSLGLTGYVDSDRIPGLQFCRFEEPENALDRLIASWARGDETAFLEGLGDQANAALEKLKGDKSWSRFRLGIWHLDSKWAAVGYRLNTPSVWSKPEETLDEATAAERNHGIDMQTLPAHTTIDVEFVTRSGAVCGGRPIEFSLGRNRLFRAAYRVDEPDMSGLLRAISTCATAR